MRGVWAEISEEEIISADIVLDKIIYFLFFILLTQLSEPNSAEKCCVGVLAHSC